MNAFGFKNSSRLRVFVVTALAMASLAVASTGAFAVPAMTSTISTTSTTAGSKIDLTTQIPAVSAVDNSTQEIIQVIDPTKVSLTAASDVTAPAGWTVTYSTDGTNYVAASSLTTPAMWAAVTKVKATGSVNSGGTTAGGKQIYSLSSTAPGTVNTVNGTVRSNGDGFENAFDSRGYMYTVYHHGALNSSLDCRVKDTGAFCPGSWPFALTSWGFPSGFMSTEYFDEVNKHVWLPTTETNVGTGFLCIDTTVVSSPSFCGGSKSTAWHLLQSRPGANEKGVYNVIASNGQIYAWDILAPKILCYDYLANNGLGAACSRPVPTFSRVTAGAPPSFTTQRPTLTVYSSFQAAFGNIYGELNGFATCFKAATMAKCDGWADFDYPIGTRYVPSTTRTAMAMYLQPTAQGGTAGVCFTSDAMCFSSDGSRFGANATVQAALINDGVLRFDGSITTTGSRLLFANLWDAPSYVFCYDYATNAACANWAASSMHGISGMGQLLMTPAGQSSWRVYTMKADPESANCMWINGDGGGPGIGQFTVSSGTFGCQVPTSTAVFTQTSVQPRLTCSIGSEYRFREFRISGVTQGVDYSSATLTIYKANGVALSSGGQTWQNIAFSSQGSVDISSVASADLGTGATFSVKYQGKTSNANTVGSIVSESESAQLCLKVTANIACPTTTQIVNLPTKIASFAASGATISSSGARVDYSSTAPDLSIAPPATPSACGFVLRGVVARVISTMSFPSTINPLAGAVATLLDAGGAVINDPATGSPITATSQADGTYSFGYVKPGSYKVSFADFPATNGFSAAEAHAAWLAPYGYFTGQVTQPLGTANFASNAVKSVVTPAAVTGIAGGSDIDVRATYIVRAVAVDDAVSVKAGATLNTIPVLSNDAPTSTNTFNNSSIKICAAGTTSGCALTTLTVAGEGTYGVTTANEITFTPLAGFTGQATGIVYGITDSFPVTVNASLRVTVIPPPVANSDTETGNLLAPITVDVTSNDTAATGATLVKSSVKLCATGTTTNCAQTSVAITGKGTYSVSALGEVTFTPERTFTGTAPSLTYSILDSVGNVATNTVTATVTPTPPAITTPAIPNATVGVLITPMAQSLTLGSSDLTATGAWTITAGSLPAGLAFNPDTGEITGTPTVSGNFTFTVKVTDAAGLTATKEETITVFVGPTITTTPLSYTVYKNEAANIPNTVTPGSGAILSAGAWVITSGSLPSGLSLNPVTGAITGTPTQTGTFTITEKVTDVNALSDTESITITVIAKPEITTPVPFTPLLQGVAMTPIVQTKIQGSATIPATGAWTIATGALPPGLSFNPDNGTITGTPTATGVYNFTVQLTDAAGLTSTKAESISVITGPVITTSPTTFMIDIDTPWTLPETYTQGTGVLASANPWTFTALPAGLSANRVSGVISGTPTAIGSTNVTVTVVDVNGLSDTEVLVINVVKPPKITTPSDLGVFEATVGITPIPLAATVGSAPITAWSIDAGALPAGLNMDSNGVISGTPGAAGDFQITAKIVDANGRTDTKVYNLKVVPFGTNLTRLTLPPAIAVETTLAVRTYPLAGLGTSSKGLPVTYSAGPASVCYVDSSGNLQLLGLGNCTVKATSGTGALLSNAELTFPIKKAPQTVTIIQPGTTVNGITAPKATDSSNGFKLVAPMSSGLPGVFSSLTPKICLVEPDGQVTWMVDASKAGMNTCKVKVTQPGDNAFFPLVDSPANVFDIVASHVASPSKPADAVTAEAPIGTPRTPGSYKQGPWTITITAKKITVLGPVSSGTFIGPVIAVTNIPYVDAKGKKKIQVCNIKFGRETPFKKTDPAAWKNRLTAPTKPCELNAEAFAYFMKGNSVKLTTKVTRDRRWPTTNKNRVGDDGKGKLIPKIISNWKITIG